MEIFRSLESLPVSFQFGAVSIGNFDGVHRGHAQLINCLRKWADQIDGPAIVFTFDPHPVRILRPDETPPPLTWTERKADLLSALGVNALIAYPATPQLLEMTHDQFFAEIIVKRLQARAIVEGPNFLFGKNRLGNTAELGRLCKQNQIELEIVEPIVLGGNPTDASEPAGAATKESMVSSSRIREAIRLGDIEEASQMLTRPYRIRGMVTHGAGRGAQLGFPTANLEAVDTLIPGRGVYAGAAFVDSEPFAAAIHVGANPTFEESNPKLEVHLLNFQRSLYGQVLEVEFHSRLRDVTRFESPEQLKRQIETDIESLRQWWQSRRTSPDPQD